MIPVRIPGLTDIRKVSMNSGFRFAVTEDGTVWHWGFRRWGENHQPICQTTPVQLPRIVDAVDVSAHWEALIQGANGNLYVFEP